ncbi:Uma2 family endonuclease [Corallococcus carmarthensis]|uniref:Uma2 family endonuclease n=1 Tax=Corallococcus carmarthensis TaxID=2316728 RepID=A0A3A8JU83_9BACT|nr:Uma2 family endonuclease [Corallococcus carmarthensis]NOK23466.1 Uma2 family endonuclease [Corallococcus carmarthensis]RKG93971.1 Uma2 family endonuclease [Corallococcus carmarthensis]
MGKKPATYADLEALPEHVVGEIVAGELYASPRPAFPHLTAASFLMALLGNPFVFGLGGPGGWYIVLEPRLNLGDDVLIPDLAGWRRERLPRAPKVVALALSPDWVCEVLSPSTRSLDLKVKLPVYAREGVRHVWFIDPVLRTLEVFRLESGQYVQLATHSGTDPVHAEPFEAVALTLSVLWDELG